MGISLDVGNRQLLGDLRQVTLLSLYHPGTQRGLCPCHVPTSAKRTRWRFRQSRNRRGGRSFLSLQVSCHFRGCIPLASRKSLPASISQASEGDLQMILLPSNLGQPAEG